MLVLGERAAKGIGGRISIDETMYEAESVGCGCGGGCVTHVEPPHSKLMVELEGWQGKKKRKEQRNKIKRIEYVCSQELDIESEGGAIRKKGYALEEVQIARRRQNANG